MVTGTDGPSGAKPLVLIVDDDPTNLFVLDEFLRGAGFATLTATNGAEAVEITREQRPPMILMDLSMPVMDGFEATRRILQDKTADTLPVILAVSANVTPKWQSSCLEAGMEDFVEKPIDFDSPIDRLNTIAKRLGA